MTQSAAPTVRLQLVQSNSLPALGANRDRATRFCEAILPSANASMRANWRRDSAPAAAPYEEALRGLEESRLVRSEKNRGVFVRENIRGREQTRSMTSARLWTN